MFRFASRARYASLTLGTISVILSVWPVMGAEPARIPDFSGVWSHPFLTGFEPPASGPGPVRNKSRRPDWPGQFPASSRGLHQSHSQARGRRNREAARRPVVGRCGLSDPKQSMLARRGALHFLGFLGADVSGARSHHDDLPPGQ